MKQSLSALAADLLPIGTQCDYWFTGKQRPQLQPGDELVFRFKGQLLGEGRFLRWANVDEKHMQYMPTRRYRVRVRAADYFSPGQTPYPFVPRKVVTTMRHDAMDDGDGPYVATGEGRSLTKHRIGQGEVRSSALIRYESRCCLCRMDEPSLLVAGHICGWAKGRRSRGNPSNVVLMCALHDSVFGKGLITLTPDTYRVRFSKGRLSAGALRHLKRFTAEFRPPTSSPPAAKFLAWHKKNIFVA